MTSRVKSCRKVLLFLVILSNESLDPDGEIENSGKIRIPNFWYIQVIVFDLSYLPEFSISPSGSNCMNHTVLSEIRENPWIISEIESNKINMETILASPTPVWDATAAGGEAPPDGFLFASLFGIRNRHLTHQKI